jgi:ABC-type multidrug transport system fused ATPase/permease subunit
MRKVFTLFKMFYKISPSYVYLLFVTSLLSSLQIFLNVILPKFLIDELIGAKRINYIIIYTVVIVASNLLFNFINKTIDKWNKTKTNYIENKMFETMSTKIMSTKFKYLEDPYYLDLKERAIFAWQNQAALRRVIIHSFEIIKNIITIAGLIAVMLTLDSILVIAMVITIAVAILIRLMFIKYQIKFMQSLIPINRKYFYYANMPSEIKLAKDFKLYDMANMVSDSFYNYNELILQQLRKFFKKEGIIEGLISIINSVQTFIVYLYIGYKVFLKQINIGSFVMYVSSATSFAVAFKETFDNIMNLYQCINYLEPFIEFMELEDEVEIKAPYKLDGDIKTIRFENVSFKYPKSETLVLDNISFSINEGEKISVVGLNGAGKTTLVKLLCRLYEPTSGNIYINDINIFDYDYASYIDKISAVFQDYKLFDFSIKDNIITTNKVDDEKLMRIIDEVGLKEKIDSLPKGIESNLNKNFDLDGVELSGGQAQKVAIARSLYKDASLIILDEPTSALDPISEADIYNNFNNMVKDKTAIYISHRMSSSVFCDRILVIEGGKIKDYDTHANLMKKHDSLYYQLFNSQAKNYQL